MHLKTDDSDLVTFAERAMRGAGGRVVWGDDRTAGTGGPETAVQTTYEKRYRREGRTIYERDFCFDS